MYTPTYWNEKGKYEKAYARIWSSHIPMNGSCTDMRAELVRCISRVYYDIYNNGGGNVLAGSYFLVFMGANLPEHLQKEFKVVNRVFDDADEDNFSLIYKTFSEDEYAIALDRLVDGIVSYVYKCLFGVDAEEG